MKKVLLYLEEENYDKLKKKCVDTKESVSKRVRNLIALDLECDIIRTITHLQAQLDQALKDYDELLKEKDL